MLSLKELYEKRISEKKELYKKNIIERKEKKLEQINTEKQNCVIFKNEVKKKMEEMKINGETKSYLDSFSKYLILSPGCLNELKKELPDDKIKFKAYRIMANIAMIVNRRKQFNYIIQVKIKKGWLGYYWQFKCI